MPRAFDPIAVLSKPLMATLSSLSEDGAPRTAPVWYIWEDEALWMLGGADGSTVRRLGRDPRCSVEITDFDREAGILLHVGLRGTADITPMDTDRFRRLLQLYLDGGEATWNPWFIDNVACIDDPDGRMIRLAPDSIFTNNVSYFRTGPDLAWP